ncbi:MAG: hypothetical protein CUN53_18290, partial [Phototrophicales bacterium]
YPYVYMLARVAFREQAAISFEAAQLMGLSRFKAFIRLVMPLAYPQLAAGTILAMLEAMTDYGTVSYFGFPTLSERIVVLWSGEFNPNAATQLAFLMILVALTLITLERRMRGKAKFYQNAGQGRCLRRHPLRGVKRIIAITACAALFGAAFMLPVTQLLAWVIAEVQSASVNIWNENFAVYAGNSLFLAGVSAAIVTFLALLIAYGLRTHASKGRRISRLLARGVTLS